MTLALEMGIEAALYNEHTLAWEPFIEPILDKNGEHLSPWNIQCSIEPVSFGALRCDLIYSIRYFRFLINVYRYIRKRKCLV